MISRTNWHQDLWAFEHESNDTNVVTVWIPITKSTVENGCLEVLGGSHFTKELSVHCKPSPTRYGFKGIPEEIVFGERIPIICDPGDVLVMDKLTQHHSLVNTSDEVRLSFDLRYQPVGEPERQAGRHSWIALSKSNPESEISDAKVWKNMCKQIIARESSENLSDDMPWRLSARYNLEHPLCY